MIFCKRKQVSSMLSFSTMDDTCALHFGNVQESDELFAFTPTTRETATEKAKVWCTLPFKEECFIARNFIQSLETGDAVEKPLFYHRHCYVKFTVKKRIDAAIKSESECLSAPKKLRSSSAFASTIRKTYNLFPEVCVICEKKEKWTCSQGKRQRDLLSVCQSSSDCLLKAALMQNAQHVLRYVRDQDPAATEVKYHRSCYKEFVKHNPKTNHSDVTGNVHHQQEDMATTSNPNTAESFIRPCASTSLSECSIGGFTVSTDSESEDGLSPMKVLRKNLKNVNTPVCYIDSHDFLSDLYRGALALKHVLATPRRLTCWPPTGEDFSTESFQEYVPDLLFNFLAWACDLTDDDIQTARVSLKADKSDSQVKVHSVAHDLMGLNNKRVSPKQLMLSVATRHITGSKRLVDILHGLGHGASYSSVLEQDTALAEKCARDSGLCIPSGFQKREPTIIVWDNNDFNEETVTGRGTTHCTTGILIQRIREDATQGDTQNKQRRSYKKSCSAPRENIIPFTKKREANPVIKPIPATEEYVQSNISLALDLAYCLMKLLGPTSLPGWVGFNEAITKDFNTLKLSRVGYLPIINANATELDTCNTVLHRSVEIADELQLPAVVLVMDQALYSKAQQIRWSDDFLQQRLVLRLGAFHTVMCFLAVLGKRFRDAGLEDVMVESGLVAPGSIQGVMTGHHYNRSVRAHNVVSEAFGRLMWLEFLNTLPDDSRDKAEECARELISLFSTNPSLIQEHVIGENVLFLLNSFTAYTKEQARENPTFGFWLSYIHLVFLLQQFLRATRTGNWELHLESLEQMIPLFFAYDRVNYARYLPCYLSEMKNLAVTHPEVDLQLRCGDFGVKRQQQIGFCQTACDQVIEQTVNRHSKTQGGLIGKTRKKGAVYRWILTSHIRGEITSHCEEIARGKQFRTEAETVSKHLKPRSISVFQQHVTDVVDTIHAMVNPFQLLDHELINISSGVVAEQKVQDDLLDAPKKGQAAYNLFTKERLEKKEKSVFAPIKCLKLSTFADVGKMVKCSSGKQENVTLKAGKALLTRMLHLGAADSASAKETLSYPLLPVPPCLGHYDGSLVKTNKAKLMEVFEEANVADEEATMLWVRTGAFLIDGMAFIQTMKTSTCQTFAELSQKILDKVFHKAQQMNSDRVDFIADTYPVVSIKGCERQRRAAGGISTIKIMKGCQPLPKQWRKFLASSENKTSFIEFLFADWCKKFSSHVKLYFTHGKMCHLIQFTDGIVTVQPVLDLTSDHEEADTRLFLHARHASMTHDVITIMSPDTDVAVISASVCREINAQLIIVLKYNRILDFNRIMHFSPSYCTALVGLHVYTGCDSISAFHGKGKSKALKLMEEEPEFEQTFARLGKDWTPDKQLLESLEKFVCHLFGRKKESCINSARYNIFCQGTANDRLLPPTQDCLIQHALRANYQAAIYRRCLQSNISAPSPEGFGWEVCNGKLVVKWTTQALAPEKLLSSVGCKCKKRKCVDGTCGCKKKNLRCGDMCNCGDCCNRQEDVVSENSSGSDYSDNSDASDDESDTDEEW